MSRLALVALASSSFALPSFAQLPNPGGPHPVTAPIRDAGILHVHDGSWTRRASASSLQVALGADVLYDNTCSADYFDTVTGATFIDEGRIPGTNSPDDSVSKPGCATSYSVEGFQIAYCTELNSANFVVSFYSTYVPCSSAVGVTPVASFALNGLPGDHIVFAAACWTATIDISATPFVIDAGASNPHFGFALSTPQTTGTFHGPILAGGANCQSWDGTSFDPVVNLSELGSGMGNLDQFQVDGVPVPFCHTYPNTFTGMWLELYGSTCAPDGNGQVAYCIAGTPGVTCPCSQTAASGPAGCRNSFGTGGRLTGSGTASLAADTVVLDGSGMPPNSSVLYFQGTQRVSHGFGNVFGDGVRCAGGQVRRLGSKTNSGLGASQYPGPGDASVSVRGEVMLPGTRTYQAWYRNAAAFCTPAVFNLSNGWQIVWSN